MKLGFIFNLGDSFESMAKVGQADKFKKFYLNEYAKSFKKIYIFSYANERVNDLPRNVELIANEYNLHRYIYALLFPLLNYKYIKECGVFRVHHLLGTPPAILLKILFNKKFIFNYAYDYYKFALIEKKYTQAVFLKLLEPFAMFFSHKYYVANLSLYKRFKKSKSVYLPNGVDTRFFKPAGKKRGKDELLVLCVGRLERQKNYLNLIRAFKGLPVKLRIIGRGSLRVEIERLARQLNVRLEIIDKVESSSIPKVYRSADVFILPSLIEGHPKVLLEAMSCGLACVGSNVFGIKEILQNNKTGIICETEPNSIRKALEKTLADSNLRMRLGKAAREFITKNFELKDLLITEIKMLKDI